ncbi:NF-X1 finger and helicase domain protein [Venturia nashicola]|nr:NF-X1 finger and helicase domain protein [Venturia nashicola]
MLDVTCRVPLRAIGFRALKDQRYCQICASDNIKDLRADVIMLSSYAEIDLSETPCIFLPCGHIFTIESLDGIMAMSEYYELDTATGMPLALNGRSKAYSYEEVKACPDCRSSLRLVSRYGRIVRRALLDESTKKFITWSNREFMKLARSMQALQAQLIETRSTVTLPTGNVVLAHGSHVRILGRLLGIGQRYRPILALREQIDVFLKQTSAEEQPFKRVHDIVESLRRRRWPTASLSMPLTLTNSSPITWLPFGDRFGNQMRDQVDFSQCRDSCETLVELATSTSNILQQAEGHIFWAHLAGLECERTAERHLDGAKVLCTEYPGQTNEISSEVDDVRRLLLEAGYQSQMKMVVVAMQGEFSGTGHWYRYCTLPQCNAPIGGSSHRPADGVQYAGDIEREFGSMRI